MNTQTSVLVKKSDDDDVEKQLQWSWRGEELLKTMQFGKGHVSTKHLLDQKVMNDVSDYLWYMTRLVYLFSTFQYILIYVVTFCKINAVLI